MKCPNCGNNLTIDDAKCPFCRQDNPFAKKHRRDMRFFKKEFNKTKKTVLEESKKVNENMVKLIAILVFALIFILSIFLYLRSYEVSEFVTKSSIKSNFLLHQERINEYEAKRDYIALYQYYTEYELFYGDIFDEYERVFRISDSYSQIFNTIMNIQEYDPSKTEDNYLSTGDTKIRTISDEIISINKNMTPDEWDDPKMFDEPHKSFMEDCKKDAEELLQVYLGLSADEVESLYQISEAKRLVLIEEAVLRNEKKDNL